MGLPAIKSYTPTPQQLFTARKIIYDFFLVTHGAKLVLHDTSRITFTTAACAGGRKYMVEGKFEHSQPHYALSFRDNTNHGYQSRPTLKPKRRDNF
jgi:hypothetical protein